VPFNLDIVQQIGSTTLSTKKNW